MRTQQTKRLFFALWPPDDVRRKISSAAETLIAQRALTGYPSKPRRYHMTLFFLGDEVTPEFEQSARRVAQRIQAPPFELRLDQLGSFNNREIPVWLGCSNIPPELKFLDQSLRKGLKGLPHGRQPRFAPHLTILRNATKRVPPSAIQALEWQVREFVLIHSQIADNSVNYTVLERYPLAGRPLAPVPEQKQLF